MPSGIWFSGDFTLALWVKVISYGCCDRIMGLRDSSGSSFLVFSLCSSQGPYIASSASHNFIYSNRLQIGQWSHLAFTYSNSTAMIYINGIQVKQGACSVPSNINYNGINYFGFYQVGAPNAVFDDVMIFNRSLTQTEIQQVI